MENALPEEVKHYIEIKLQTGQYSSAEEVFREAFHLLDVRDAEREEYRRSVREGFEQIHRGEYVVFDDEFEQNLFDRAMAVAEARRNAGTTRDVP